MKDEIPRKINTNEIYVPIEKGTREDYNLIKRK